jgi:hypothetical protein
MVLYGIKVNNRILTYSIDTVNFIHVGESNRALNTDKYTCSFSKMIQYWRQTWYERTNRTTNIQFPFGFVQVRFTQNHQ